MAGWPALLLLLLLFFSLSLYLDFLPLFRLHPGRRGDLSELRPGRPGRQEGYGATGTYRVRFSSARQKKSFSKTLPGLNATLHCNVAPCHTITHTDTDTDTDTHSRRNFLQSLPPRHGCSAVVVVAVLFGTVLRAAATALLCSPTARRSHFTPGLGLRLFHDSVSAG